MNRDEDTVKGFGEEWGRFTQAELDDAERRAVFDEYFAVFPWDELPRNPVGADIGCGSGRWAALVAPRVARLHVVDASPEALSVARRNLSSATNVEAHLASVDELPFAEASLDFAYSLGVLHHVPDTFSAIRSIARVLKPGAPLLVYLYYAFDNRPLWFKALWGTTDLGRRLISRFPPRLRYASADALAVAVYWPLARAAALLDRAGKLPASWPLSAYRHRSFYVMRTDALDRFGTRLEQRFSRTQIREMLERAGLRDVRFHEGSPYWCAVAFKREIPAASSAPPATPGT